MGPTLELLAHTASSSMGLLSAGHYYARIPVAMAMAFDELSRSRSFDTVEREAPNFAKKNIAVLKGISGLCIFINRNAKSLAGRTVTMGVRRLEDAALYNKLKKSLE